MSEPLRRPWGELGPLAFGTAALFGAWFVARTSSSGVPHDVAIATLGLAAVTIGVVAVARWRVGLYLFLAWLVFEDLPRKFLGNDLLVYFGKDLLAAAVYLGFFLELRAGRVRTFRPPFLAVLLFFAGVCAVQVLNPNSPSPLYGLLGLKLYLYYVPLMFVGHALIKTERDLRYFLVFNLALAGIVAAIGVVQAIVGAGFLNPATTPGELELLRVMRRAPITGELVPRPTSVFVSDGRFALYMLLGLFLALAAASYGPLRRGLGRWIVRAALALSVGAILLSGSRGAFVYAVASVLIYGAALLWGTGGRTPARLERLRSLAHLGLVIGVAAVGAAVFFPEAVGARWAFYYQTIAPWSSASELTSRIHEYPQQEFVMAFSYPNWPLGYGLGTASLGVQYLTAVVSIPTTGAAVESGYGTVLLELGAVGLLSWLVWTLTLMHVEWHTLRTLRGTSLFPVGFSVFWFSLVLLFPMMWGGLAAYQNFVFNAFFWLLLGVFFRLPGLVARVSAARSDTVARGAA